jgi:hypothetical protein
MFFEAEDFLDEKLVAVEILAAFKPPLDEFYEDLPLEVEGLVFIVFEHLAL